MDDDPLYIAQHARSAAHVRPYYLPQPRESHRRRNSNRSDAQILKENGDAPALDQVFIRIAERSAT